ncbi:MAG: hypothetical protein Q8K30_06715 [Candidatus Gracilibacteria bacterium]|nr:hypothetical protein [Candidatus Gracilibacteria bacterium]
MKKMISLIVVAILLGLSNVNADTSTGTTDSTTSNTGTVVSIGTTESVESNTGAIETTTVISSTGTTSSTENMSDTNDIKREDRKNYSNTGAMDDNRKEVQKRFAKEFNDLKDKFKDRNGNKEYINKKNELFKLYKEQVIETHSGATAKIEEIKINFKEQKQELRAKLQEKRQEIKQKYSRTYSKKYGYMISKLDETKVNTLITKIDALITDVNNSDKTDETKAKLIAMLESLKELANKRIEELKIETELNLDALFQ